MIPDRDKCKKHEWNIILSKAPIGGQQKVVFFLFFIQCFLGLKINNLIQIFIYYLNLVIYFIWAFLGQKWAWSFNEFARRYRYYHRWRISVYVPKTAVAASTLTTATFAVIIVTTATVAAIKPDLFIQRTASQNVKFIVQTIYWRKENGRWPNY